MHTSNFITIQPSMTWICCCFFPLVTVVKQVWPLHFPVTRSFYYSASCNHLIKRTATAVHRSHRERGINYCLVLPPPSVLDCLQNAKSRGERPGLIYHRRDINVYRDRQRKEGAPDQNNDLEAFLAVPTKALKFPMFVKQESCHETWSFSQGPPPPPL